MADFSDVISRAIKSMLSQVHTCLPGRIKSYDYSTQKAEVLPLLNNVYSDGEIIEMPVIADVPVIFPTSAAGGLTFPIAAGDGCLLVFAERSIDKWLSMGGVVSPDDPRRFDLSDCIAIPGLNPFTVTSQAENNDDLILKNGDAMLKIDSLGRVALGTSTGELLDIIEQLIDEINALLIVNPVNPAAPLPVMPASQALITAVKAKITAIKATI